MRRLALAALFALTGCTQLPRGPADGALAPLTQGADAEGRPLALAEHQGKAVLLSFWHSRCPPCRALFARERALAERFAGRPFVLLGVNADPSQADALRCQKAAGLTWRSFYDGPDGPICAAWKVDRFPTLVLIDGDGAVRWRHVGVPGEGEAERKVEELLRDPPRRVPAAEVSGRRRPAARSVPVG